MKKSCLVGSLCAFIFSALSTSANASLVVPAGLNPGDAYHVIFVSSTGSVATSSDISSYDAFVQNVANNAGIGTGIGVDWSVVGSTPTVDAVESPLIC